MMVREGKGTGWGLDMGREEEQTRSRVWPFTWVGKWICWVRWKQSRRERKSGVRGEVGRSTWMLRSPVSRRREEREDAMVRSSDSSSRKEG